MTSPTHATPAAEGPVGVLLVNLGTPDAPRAPEVRRYLREFLGDPRVIDMNPVGRWLLLNLIILPFRPKQSAEAYEQIWTEAGSPLLLHGEALTALVAERLPGCEVALAMRYGKPSLPDVLDELRAKGCQRIVVAPLYPQYASSTTGSTLERVYQVAGALWNTPSVVAVPAFYDDPGFVEAAAVAGRRALDEANADHVLFSFHGLPERQVLKSDEAGGHCLQGDDCCATVGRHNAWCYRAQCYATARGISAALDLSDDGYTVSFQSRLGKIPWIRPYTDETLKRLAGEGVKRLAVFCPAFVADCLETIEEIGIRGRETFLAAGGEELVLVPCVNAEPAWGDALAALIRRTTRWIPEA